MRSTMPRHRWETVATAMTPGAHLTHGRVSIAAPLAEPIREYLTQRCAQHPVIAGDPVTAALMDARMAGVKPTVGNLVDITPFLAARQAAEEEQHDA